MPTPTKPRVGRPLQFGRMISLRLTPADVAKIDEIAAALSVTRADAFRRILAEYRVSKR